MEAFVHIGTPKTGTTTIQKFMAANRRNLQTSGFIYPLSPGKFNHTKLAAFAQDLKEISDIRKRLQLTNTARILEFRDEFKKDLDRELKKTQHEKFIFSNEHCFQLLVRKEEILSLQKILYEFFDDVKIIVYLRRQDDFLLSSYSTRVKTGCSEKISIPNNNKIENRYDYWAILKKWEEVFDKKNIIVKVFEREQMLDGNLLTDFISTFGLNITDKFEVSENRNLSLDEPCLDFLRRINPYVPRFIENEVNFQRGNIVELLEMYSSNSKFTVDNEILDDFMAIFNQSNIQVAEYFLGRQDGQLFRNISDKKNIITSQDININQAFEIFAYLWCQKQEEIQNQKKTIGYKIDRFIEIVTSLLGCLSTRPTNSKG